MSDHTRRFSRMNELPDPWDHAYVVRVCGCDGSLYQLGLLVKVGAVWPSTGATCFYCQRQFPATEKALLSGAHSGTYPHHWLKRQPPPAGAEHEPVMPLEVVNA